MTQRLDLPTLACAERYGKDTPAMIALSRRVAEEERLYHRCPVAACRRARRCVGAKMMCFPVCDEP